MKTSIILICLALSAAAWGAEPAADTAATADTAAPSAQAVKPAEQKPATTPVANEQKATTPAASEQKTAQQSAQSGFSRGSVVRSVFTTGVKDREPVNKLNKTKTHDDHIYFFTELRDMSGQTAIHRWEHDGKVAAQVEFKVRGPRWRVWSSKTFAPNATGEWKVSVLNGAGEVIAEDEIDYTGPAAAQKPAATQAPAAATAPAEQQAPAATTAPPAEQQAPAQQPAGGSMSQ